MRNIYPLSSLYKLAFVLCSLHCLGLLAFENLRLMVPVMRRAAYVLGYKKGSQKATCLHKLCSCHWGLQRNLVTFCRMGSWWIIIVGVASPFHHLKQVIVVIDKTSLFSFHRK